MQRAPLAVAMLLLVGACSGGDTGPSVLVPAVTAIAISPSTSTIVGAGQSVPLTATLTVRNGPIAAPAIVWSSSDAAIASVTGAGMSATVTSVSPGSATITAQIGSVSATMQTIVAAAVPIPVATITLAATSSQLVVGQNASVTATLRAADNTVLTGRTIAWSSSNAAAVAVTPAGQLTAVASGSVTISATAEGKTGTILIVSSLSQSSMIGNWTGTYTCSAPISSGRLTLSVVTGLDNAPTAQFTFYDSPINPAVPFGSFAMRGVISGASVNFDADEADWIVQPPTATTFDLRGMLSADGTTYSGTIPQSGCTGFTMRKASISSGLVAYYPFTGNATDQSGNGFHGTALGATLITDRLGVANAAYDFAGTSSVVAPVFLPSASISVTAWIRLRTPRCWGGILDGFREKWEFVLDCVSGDRLEFAQWLSNGAFVDQVDTPRLTTGQWYHVAVTINGTQGQFFIDGLPTRNFTLSAPALTLPSLLSIGHSASGTSQFFDGALDDIRLYNRALTPVEVRELCRTEAATLHSCKTAP